MRIITLFDYGDKVSPTPDWVALRADEDSPSEMAEMKNQAENGVGVITGATITQGKVMYSVEWRTRIAPDYMAWFAEEELRSADEPADFSSIPFDKYRDDWRSENTKSKKEFRQQLRDEIQQHLKKMMEEAISREPITIKTK